MIREMANKILNKAKTSYEKFQVRGAIKEIMRNYGLRTISLANYDKYTENTTCDNIHSVRYDIMNGYIHLHGYNKNGKCGEALETVDLSVYKKVYQTILNILDSEHTIPSKVKRNILVKVNR